MRKFMVVIAMIIVAAIILPIPALVLDILIAMNMVFAAVILIAALRVKKVTDFSLCPTMILVLTLFNLAVNISAVRLILTKGADFDGRLIRFASSWLAGSGGEVPLIVGCVLFVAVLAILTLVIIKRATRISEVAAVFTLDAMPGRQMAINADLSAGEIDEKEALNRKKLLQKESDFYCAMDGASKFISGYEKLIIFGIAVTIIGGIVIHRSLFDEPGEWQLMDAVKSYVPLAISNGLLSMLPAFLISITAGIVVTRSALSRDEIAE